MSFVRPKNTIKGNYRVISSFDNIVGEIKNEIKSGRKRIAIEFYPITNEKLIKDNIIKEDCK